MERQVEEGGSRYVATQGRQVGKGPESLEGGWVMDLSRRARKTESGQRSFGDDEEEQAKAEGSGEAKEEIKIPEPTLDPDLQIFCKLIFNSE